VPLGWDGSNRLDDTWEYNGTDWVQVETSNSPPAKNDHSMTYDSGRGKVILFGGATNTGASDDTWEYPCSLFGDLDCDCDVDVADIMEVASRWHTLPPRNFVPNSSFENGTTSPDGWHPALAGADYGWDDSVAHTGNRSIRISNVKGHHSVEWETTDFIAIKAGLDYEASVWIKGTSSLEAYCTVSQYDANGNHIYGIGFSLPYTSSVWTQSTHPIRIYPGTTKVTIDLGLNNPGPDDTESVWFDDVSFSGAGDHLYDLDHDGDIDIVDIMLVVARWGDSCEDTNGIAFEDDFEDGNAYDWVVEKGWWICTADWEVVLDDENFVYGPENGNGGLSWYDASWSNYTYEARIKFPEGASNDAAIIFLWQNEDNWYGFRVKDGLARIFGFEGGGERDGLASAYVAINPDQWYTMRIVLQGNTVQAYLDGNPVLEYNELKWSSGAIGVQNDGGPLVYFDDIKVTIEER